MNTTEKSGVHSDSDSDSDVPFSRARIPGMMREIWPATSIAAAGLLAMAGSAHAGGWSTNASSTQVAPGGTFTVTSIYNYDGNCGVRARVRYVSGSCSPGGDTGWQGHTSNCSGGGTASRTYTLDASPVAPCLISGDGTDNTSHYYQNTYTIQATQSITVTTAPPASKKGGTSFPVAATASSGLPVVINVAGNCTYAAPNVTMTKTTGTCTVTFSRGDNGTGTWVPAADQVYTVNATGDAQTITVTTAAPASAAYTSTFPVAATSTSGRPVAITTGGSCSGSGTGSATITMTSGSGTCTVYYNQTDNTPPWSPAPQVTSGTTATKLNQALTFPDQVVNTRVFANLGTFLINPLATRGSPDSGNAITYSSLNNAVCTVAGTTVTMKSVGACTLAADQAGNANYNAAPQMTQVVDLTKTPQKIEVMTHAPGTKVSGGTFSVNARALELPSNNPNNLPVTITGQGSCSGSGSSTNGAPSVTITMTSGVGICTVVYTQPGNGSYEMADPITEYVTADSTGGSGCFGEGTYTALQFQNTGGYMGWACNDGSFVAPGHSISCWPPLYLPWIRPGWSIQPGIGFKGHVLQTALNPGKTFKVQAAPGGGGYYNILNLTDATCIASGNGVYEAWSPRKGSNSSAGYLVAFQDTDTMPSGRFCDYSNPLTKWKMNISGAYATFENQGYPTWPSKGCMGSDSGWGLSRVLLDWGNGNYGNWGDSWVRNAAPSCASGGAKISCGGYQPKPPDHVRFEFDATTAYICQPPKVTIKVCSNQATTIGSSGTCDPFNAYAVLKPRSSKGTWNNLGAMAPLTGFTAASSGITLSHTVIGDTVNLFFSSPSMVLADTTLECYDTKANKRVSCVAAMTYKDCPPFDAVEPGKAAGESLYTKLAGTAFGFDVVAGLPSYVGAVKVELVDNSSGGACAGLPSLQTIANPYNFVLADNSRKNFTTTYSNAAATVAVRMTAGGTCYLSNDNFTIRPKQFTVAPSYPGGTPPKAGVAFTLTATAQNTAGATTAGYTGTPKTNDAYIYDWNKQPISGMLSGAFPAAAAGVSTGASFKFQGIGALTFPDYTDGSGTYPNFVANETSAVQDILYTKASGDQPDDPNAPADCVVGSFSTTLNADGKYGCNIGSAGVVTTAKFVPDHYKVEYNIVPACSATATTYTYFGQDFATPPVVKITAQDADDNQLSTLTAGYTPADKPTFKVEAMNAGAVVANPASAAPVNMVLTTPYDWNGDASGGGVYVNTSSGQVPRPVTPVNYESFALKTTLVANLGGATIKDATYCVNGTISLNKLECTSNQVTRLRFGVLKLENGYGTDQLPIFVRVTAMYWDAASSTWLRNQGDSCTTLNTNTADANRNMARGNYKVGLSAGNVTSTAASLPLVDGQASIRFDPTPGVTGSADVAINLGATTSDNAVCPATALEAAGTVGANLPWLRGNWCGTGYGSDPVARINSGTAKSQFLYLRERY